MYKIPVRTLFLGKNLVYVPQCDSTNLLASELGQKLGTPDGSVIITDDQTAGRGQRGNAWESHPGKNLTFSVILKPSFLAVKDQFQLNEAMSIGIAAFLTAKGAQKVQIKWPNDILVGGRKVCGILIENHLSGEEISHCIVGIGLNINQTVFQYPQAGSLRLVTGMEYRLPDVLEELLESLEASYFDLRKGNQKKLENQYLALLYQKDEVQRFNIGAEVCEGVITGVNEAGQLAIMVDGEKRFFGVKEVQFLVPGS